MATFFVLTFYDGFCLFVVYIHIVYFLTFKTSNFLCSVSVNQVSLAVPAKSFFWILVFAFCSYTYCSIRPFNHNRIQKLFFAEVIIKVFSFFILPMLRIKFVFKHRIWVWTTATWLLVVSFNFSSARRICIIKLRVF